MRNKFLPLMAEFFEDQGKLLSSGEYARLQKKPMTGQAIKRHFGSYPRMLKAVDSYLKKVPSAASALNKPAPVDDKVQEIAAKLKSAKTSNEVTEEFDED